MKFVVLLCILSVCEGKLRGLQALASMTETISRFGDLSSFGDLLISSDLGSFLDSSATLTLFAPRNQAIEAALPSAAKLTDPQYISHLVNLLSYHVVLSDIITSGDAMEALSNYTTANGEIIRFGKKETEALLVVDTTGLNSTVSLPDTLSLNGVMHHIDRLLIPKFFSQTLVDKAVELETFGVLLELIGRVDSLLVDLANPNSNLTLLAPSDDAFRRLDPKILEYLNRNAELLEDLLRNHVVGSVLPSDTLDVLVGKPFETFGIRSVIFEFQLSPPVMYVNGARIASYDNIAFNGVLHTIDDILLPSPVEVLSDSDEFATFLDLLSKSDDTLESLKSRNGTFTIFAPISSAFEKLNPSILGYLMRNDAVLKSTLHSHIVSSLIPSYDLQLWTKLETIGETPLIFDFSTTEIEINGISSIESTDLLAYNAFIHSVDTVILPRLFVRGEFGDLSVMNSFTDVFDFESFLPENFTMFAPNDEAFKVFFRETEIGSEAAKNANMWSIHLFNILVYHTIIGQILFSDELDTGIYPVAPPFLRRDDYQIVTSDGNVVINGIDVIHQDIVRLDGVIHKLNGVMLPAFATVGLIDQLEARNDIINASIAIDLFKSAGLSDQLNGSPGAKTLLVPTNSAFDLFSSEDLTELLSNEAFLLEILNYHVILEENVRRVALSADMSRNYTTANGQILHVTDASSSISPFAEEGRIRIQGASGEAFSDQLTVARNGIVYYIDTLLIPDIDRESSSAPSSEPTLSFSSIPSQSPTLVPTAFFLPFEPSANPSMDFPTNGNLKAKGSKSAKNKSSKSSKSSSEDPSKSESKSSKSSSKKSFSKR